MAEFLGVFLGDGNIASDYQAYISFNLKTEQPYADYLSELIFSLFRLEAKKRERPKFGAGDLVMNSCELIRFLLSQGLVKGDKIRHQAGLPPWVFESEGTIKGSLRGLFDSDGCIYRHSYSINRILYQYPKIAFTAYSPKIRSQIYQLLKQLKFCPKEQGNRVHLYSQYETLRFFKECRTHNSWHRGRFEKFCEDLHFEVSLTK